MTDNLGKKAETKIKEWLNRPEKGQWFLRLIDQMNGFEGSCNPCDFIFYKYPKLYMLESKATWQDRFDYSMITDYQFTHMLAGAQIEGVTSYIVVLFATYKRAFLLDILDIAKEKEEGRKSINVKKIDKWKIPFIEIRTIPSRKELLDYDPDQVIFL